MREIRAINCIVKPDAGLCNPFSLYFDSKKEELYICDFHHNRIIKRCSANKTFVLEEIPCLQMYGIFYKHSWLYITDTGHNRIVRYYTVKEGLEVILWSGITPISVTVGDDNRIYFNENRRIFCLFSNGRKVLLLDRKLWKEYNFECLGHIGAMAIGDKNRLFFSDTIRNCVY